MQKELLTPRTVELLESSEIAYWSKYYGQSAAPLPSHARFHKGAFLGCMPGVDILAMNRVIGLGISAPVTPADIQEITDYYLQLGAKRFFIQLAPVAEKDEIAGLLSAAGFRYYNNWVKLGTAQSEPLPDANPCLEIVKVDASLANAYGDVLFASFDWKDERLRQWLSSVVGHPDYIHYLACLNGKPVAAAALHLFGAYASMAFAGTLPEYRGIGAQSLLINARISKARSLGCTFFVAETAQCLPGKPVQSYANLVRAGFSELYLRENWLFECG